MQPRFRLLHEFGQQLRVLAPTVRVTRVRPLAALSPGLLWAGRIALTAVAATVPGRASDPSTERRFRRWLANRRVPVTALWRPLIWRAGRARRCSSSSTRPRTTPPRPCSRVSAASEEGHDVVTGEAIEVRRDGGMTVADLMHAVRGSLDGLLPEPADDGAGAPLQEAPA